MLKDYECTDCNKIVEYKKEYKVDFPESIVCPDCGKAMQKCMRKGSLGAVIIPEHMKSALGFSY